ncbi:hypothetical protein AAHC03_09995 [Spirometra sp. Aus1]
MHKLIVCCLLIATVCAAPAQSPALEREGGLPPKEYALNLLKNVWSDLLTKISALGKETLIKLVPALLEFSQDRDWGTLLSSILKGKTKDLWDEYMRMKNQSRSALEFIKENGTDIALEVLKFFGGEGVDLTSVSTSLLQGALAKLLRIFVRKLSDDEAYAVVGIFTGIVKLTVKLVTKSEETWPALFKFISGDIGLFVKEFLPRVFDKNGNIYKLIVKVLPSTK